MTINCLELLTVLLTQQRFYPLVQGRHMLVQDGQYCSHSVCQPPGRCQLKSHVTTPLESAATVVPASHSHSGRPQLCSRHAFTSHTLWRMETLSFCHNSGTGRVIITHKVADMQNKMQNWNWYVVIMKTQHLAKHCSSLNLKSNLNIADYLKIA